MTALDHATGDEMTTPPEYPTAPPLALEIAAVIDAATQGRDPDEPESHDLVLRTAAVLDRVALRDPDDTTAAATAYMAALALVRLARARERARPSPAGPARTPTTDEHGWAVPPRLYVRAEYARWARTTADPDPDTRPADPPYLIGYQLPNER
jgi:hypothetical protein